MKFQTAFYYPNAALSNRFTYETKVALVLAYSAI